MAGRSFNRRLMFAAASALISAAAAFQLAGILINVTPSIPLGLYQVSDRLPLAPGVIVEFCPAASRSLESRRYRSFGVTCPDWAIPLLKPVAAVAGDQVEFTARGIRVNQSLLPNTAPRSMDGKGRPIAAWPEAGPMRIREGQILVASTMHGGSYDSRYLGPIAVVDVRARLRPLLIFRF